MAEGEIECGVLTDQGRDTNLMSTKILEALVEAGVKEKRMEMIPQKVFSAVRGKRIVCKYEAKADIHLRVRHGTAWILQNVRWMISEQTKDGLIIRRPLLEKFG